MQTLRINTDTNDPLLMSIELLLDYENVGCYQDRRHLRDMGLEQTDGSLTIDECFRLCKSQSFKYFAMQFDGESKFEMT